MSAIPPLTGAVPLDHLADALRGRVITAGHPGYDDARRVGATLVDTRPAAIARCRDAAEVIAVIAVARGHGLPLVCGETPDASWDGALVADLSLLRDITVDPVAGTVRVEAGCTWGEVARAAADGVLGDLVAVDVALPDGRFVTATEAVHQGLFRAIRGGREVPGIATTYTFSWERP